MKLIIVTGPSGSGKSYLTNRLKNEFENTIVLKTDSYYRDSFLIRLISIFMIDIYDRIISIRKNELLKTIEKIIRNERFINIRNYDFITKKSSKSKISINQEQKDKILIIEGIFSHRLEIRHKINIYVFCLDNKEICYKRRLERDERDRARNHNEIRRRFKYSWKLFYIHIKKFINRNQNDIEYINSYNELSYKRLISKIRNT